MIENLKKVVGEQKKMFSDNFSYFEEEGRIFYNLKKNIFLVKKDIEKCVQIDNFDIIKNKMK